MVCPGKKCIGLIELHEKLNRNNFMVKIQYFVSDTDHLKVLHKIILQEVAGLILL